MKGRMLTAVLAVLLAAPALAQRPQGAHAKHQQLEALAQRTGLRALEVRLTGQLTPGLASRARSAFREARGGYDLLVVRLDIDAPFSESGEVIARDLAALGDELLTIAYVEGRAERAGALIALSARFIAMSPEGSIGYAEHRGGLASSTEDTTWLRKRFEDTAQRNGHDVTIARAMADPSVVLLSAIVAGEPELVTPQALAQNTRQDGEPVCGAGKRLLLPGSDAERFRLSIATIVEPGILWDRWTLDVARHDIASRGVGESIVDQLSGTIPLILLLAFGLLGIYVELVTPGIGVPGLGGAALLGLGLYVQWATGAAELAEVLIVVVGVILLIVEVTVIPGFGVIGIAGMFCIGFGALMCLQSFSVPHHTWQHDQLARNALVLMAGLGGAVGGMLCVMRFMPHLPFARRLALNDEAPVADGYVVGEPEQQALVGRHGLTTTPLRPTGKIEIDGELLDVVCDGEYLDKGAAVAVREVRGNRIVVEPLVRM